MPVPGDIGLVAKAIDTIFSWFTDANGFRAMQHRRQGDRLTERANEALRTWTANQTMDNWRKYKDAEAELVTWSNQP